MPSILISYEKSKREIVLESLSHIKGFITYKSDIINVLRYYTEVSQSIIVEIEGILSISKEGELVDSPKWKAILEKIKN